MTSGSLLWPIDAIRNTSSSSDNLGFCLHNLEARRKQLAQKHIIIEQVRKMNQLSGILVLHLKYKSRKGQTCS